MDFYSSFNEGGENMYRIAMRVGQNWLILSQDGFFGYNEALERAKLYKRHHPEKDYRILDPDGNIMTQI